MLSMMIFGPKQPGSDIDVYLSPLIEDLKLMWDQGVEVFDAFTNETFKLLLEWMALNQRRGEWFKEGFRKLLSQE